MDLPMFEPTRWPHHLSVDGCDRLWHIPRRMWGSRCRWSLIQRLMKMMTTRQALCQSHQRSALLAGILPCVAALSTSYEDPLLTQ